MIKTAIDIKEAIDNAPNNLTSIGTCEQVYLEWKNDTYGDGYDDTEDNKLLQIYELKKVLETNYCSFFEIDTGNIKINNKTTIKINNIEYQLPIDQNKLKELFNEGVESPFGNVKDLTTVVDKEVRNAREITNIEVDQAIIDKIKETWEQTLYPTSVRVVPYKLNMYSDDGKFEEHLDTPDKDLVGTALVSLWEGNTTTCLKIHDVNKKRKECWQPTKPSCVMFYSDCPHEVGNCYNYGNKSNCIRATIAFKIFSNGDNTTITDYHTNKVSKYLLPLMEDKVGFILEHGYSLQTDALKGTDALLIQTIQKLGYKFTIIPVLHHFTLSSYHNEEDEFESKVYPLREEELNYLLNNGSDNTGSDNNNKPEFEHNNIKFYIMNNKFYYWKQEHQSFCEYNGNESAPENMNSIYLSRAVIAFSN